MPTPTLVGLPSDETGYAALRRGYATQLATAVIPHLVAWECCEGAPFFQALLNYQLSQLDLHSWPVSQADYQRIQDEATSLNNAIPSWHADTLAAVDPDNQWLIYAIADFILRSDKKNFCSYRPTHPQPRDKSFGLARQ